MTQATVFMASGKGGSGPTESTPRAAALAYFERYRDRKCRVAEGRSQDHVFISPMSGRVWRDVTRATVGDLPGA
ncbi:hypothetical protein MesoLjLc_51230 [Mesorhizobium sp. L-8-10]|uniref:hypothetical protein n=1 Tax=Mesorhizobium sp. L-8-10 TaxID=2744523 RepID=UPI0019256922|nr:hypothetical protein [Mesorhizobium sp. L-8-10]BCH33193.1 hypothetical protein MesoLjLc_51230 [Mesorhizobium sp. L-8-10]